MTTNYGNEKHSVLIERLRSVDMTPKDQAEHKSLARASVLVPLFLRESTLHVLLTQRPEKLRTHSGEVCFPGGKQDPDDSNDDVATALREAREEVGLDPANVQPLCRLETLESYTGLCVTPVVGLVNPARAAEPTSLTLSEAEVEAAFAVPLAYFCDERNLISMEKVEWRGCGFELRVYHYRTECDRTFKIWGLTAYIAHQVARIAMTNSCDQSIDPKLGIGCQLYEGQSTVTGYLFQLEEGSGVGGTKPYWVRRYFVLDGQMLHRYEGERQAEIRAVTATKKNRVLLVDSDVRIIPTLSEKSRHEFLVSTLSGRVQWHLASETDEDRQHWIQALRCYSTDSQHTSFP